MDTIWSFGDVAVDALATTDPTLDKLPRDVVRSELVRQTDGGHRAGNVVTEESGFRHGW
jgi:hypothetical protein